jgi:hypothetical protein
MTRSHGANTRMRNLLAFGLAAVALTVLPPLVPMPFPVWAFLPVVGRLGLAITLTGLVLWFVTLGAEALGERGAPDPQFEPLATAHLPPAAQAIVARVSAQLDALSALVAANPVMTDTAFTIAEMRRNYLPSTIAAYSAIPPFRRGGHTVQFLEQLRLLEATVNDLSERTANDGSTALDVNGRFLTDRFPR